MFTSNVSYTPKVTFSPFMVVKPLTKPTVNVEDVFVILSNEPNPVDSLQFTSTKPTYTEYVAL